MPQLPSFESFESADQKQKLVDAVFDTVSRRYDLGNDLLSLGLHRMWKRRLLHLADVRPEHSVLDLACGTGDITWEVARLAYRGEVIGADNNPEMLKFAEPKRPPSVHNVTFVTADAAKLPFADNSFDRVIISYAARGLPDLTQVVAEVYRVLKPGGVFWNLDFGRPPVKIVDMMWRGTLASWGAVVGTFVHGNPRTYMYIPASMKHYKGQRWLQQAMTDVGFETTTIDTTLGLMAFNRGLKRL